MSKQALAIGPHAPPITGPGLKNKYIHAGLEHRGLEIDWINTLETTPRTVVDIVRKTVGYDAYILSASTKVRLFIAPLLASKLRFPNVEGALFPAGGEFAAELESLPTPLRTFYLRTFAAFDGIYPQTDDLTADLQTLFADSVQIRTVPNLRPIPESSSVCRDQPVTASSPLTLAYVGRIKESKGLDNLLAAFERARNAGTDVELDIYGHFLSGDSYREQFLDSCSKLPGLRFHGRIRNVDVIPELQQFDAFVFPTVYPGEGFPGALVEAFAASCPVIGTDWNFNGDIITDGVDGLLYEPHDVATLTDHIQWLASHPGRVSELQQQAYRTAQEYSIEHVTGMIIRYLDEAGWNIPAMTAPPSEVAAPSPR